MRSASIVLLALALLTANQPARAHAILMESQPPALAAIPPGPTQFTLRFNSRIDQARSRLELRGKTPPVALKLSAAGPDTLAAQTPLTPGEWILRWQVLAVDGHITRGDVPFTVKAP